MNALTPWALGPFEIILHAEMHYRDGDDLDRRIAVVGFDNAIELAIHTYLSLHPIQRQNRTYQRVDVEKWLANFHSKVEFFVNEATTRGLPIVCDQQNSSGITKCEMASITWEARRFHKRANSKAYGKRPCGCFLYCSSSRM